MMHTVTSFYGRNYGMGSIRKRGDGYFAEVRMRGAYACQTFRTKAEARAWEVDTERKIKSGRGVLVTGRTLGDLLTRYAAEVSPKKDGMRWEQNRIAHFGRDPLTRIKLAHLSAGDIAAWRDRRLLEVSGDTIARDMNLLSHACKIALKEWKWLDHNPVSDVSRPKTSNGRDRLCSSDELAALWHVAGSDLYTVQARVMAAFELACESGMRGGEICALTPDDVHLDRLYVHVSKSKNGDERDVSLSARAKAIVTEILELELDPIWGLTDPQKDSAFRRIRDRAGISGLVFHDSRHTAITMLAKKLHVLDLARQVGTRDLKTLMIYYNETATERAKSL